MSMDESTEEKLPLTAHLEELKKRLIRSLAGIARTRAKHALPRPPSAKLVLM